VGSYEGRSSKGAGRTLGRRLSATDRSARGQEVRRMEKAVRTVFECRACRWRWFSRLAWPRRCPSCSTTAWAEPDRRVRHGLYRALYAALREQQATPPSKRSKGNATREATA